MAHASNVYLRPSRFAPVAFRRLRPAFSGSRAPRHARKTPIDAQTGPLRIASIPAAHPYVVAVSDPLRVTVLPDPPVPGAPAAQWWPPVAMTAPWLDAHASEFDVLHVHFGLESFSPDEVRDALAAARRAERPVVFTVHDLENPQIVDQAPYTALLDVLVPAADRLITLTDTAAAEIRGRWSRDSAVIAHPTLIADLPAPARPARPGDTAVTVRVGLHLRDLRPNIAAEHAVHAAVRAAGLLDDGGPSVLVDVLMNESVRDVDAAQRVTAAAEGHPDVRLRRTPHLSDAEIESWIAGLDLFVLPYHHGTHSGWVELCYDLGVPVAGTDVGHIRSQHPWDFAVIDLDDPRTLADAVTRAGGASRDAAARSALLAERRTARLAERRRVRDAHADLYTGLLAEVHA